MADILEKVEGDIRVVKLEESQILDEQVARKVGTRLNQIVNEMAQTAIVLNFEKVKFMASAMIGQLVLLRENCRKKEIELSICSLNENLCEAIKLMRIDEILPIHENEQVAMDAMNKS